MAHRLGNVLFWLGMLAGLGWVGILLFSLSINPTPASVIVCGAFAAVSVGTGRAMQYVLAGC